LIISEAAILS